MAKRKIIIEEVISQEFEIDDEGMDESDIYDHVRRKYRNSELVVDSPSLTEASVMICDKNGNETDWLSLHV